jgi:hypothetical protein
MNTINDTKMVKLSKGDALALELKLNLTKRDTEYNAIGNSLYKYHVSMYDSNIDTMDLSKFCTSQVQYDYLKRLINIDYDDVVKDPVRADTQCSYNNDDPNI